MDDHILFGKNVRAARDAIGISRELAAERAGITTEYLGEIERGEKWPTLPVIRSIARTLSVSPARFLQFEEQETDAGTGSVLERLHRAIETRTPQEQEQALRVVRALFGL